MERQNFQNSSNLFICSSNQMKYCAAVCVIFLFVQRRFFFFSFFLIFEPRARRVLLLLYHRQCVLCSFTSYDQQLDFLPSPCNFFFFFQKTKQKKTKMDLLLQCECVCERVTVSNNSFSLPSNVKAIERLPIIDHHGEKTPPSPHYFFFVLCVCVIVFECLAML